MSETDQNCQSNESPKNANSKSGSSIVFLVLAMVCVMVFSLYYPFPDGKSLNLTGFLKLWFREIILMSAVLAFCLVYLIKKTIASASKTRAKKDAS